LCMGWSKGTQWVARHACALGTDLEEAGVDILQDIVQFLMKIINKIVGWVHTFVSKVQQIIHTLSHVTIERVGFKATLAKHDEVEIFAKVRLGDGKMHIYSLKLDLQVLTHVEDIAKQYLDKILGVFAKVWDDVKHWVETIFSHKKTMLHYMKEKHHNKASDATCEAWAGKFKVPDADGQTLCDACSDQYGQKQCLGTCYRRTLLPQAAGGPTPEISFVGCYKDKRGSPALAVQVAGGCTMSEKACALKCQALGYGFMARQGSEQCYCGHDTYAKYGPAISGCECDGGSPGAGKNCVYKLVKAGTPTPPPTPPPPPPPPSTKASCSTAGAAGFGSAQEKCCLSYGNYHGDGHISGGCAEEVFHEGGDSEERRECRGSGHYKCRSATPTHTGCYWTGHYCAPEAHRR